MVKMVTPKYRKRLVIAKGAREILKNNIFISNQSVPSLIIEKRSWNNGKIFECRLIG